MVTLTSSMLAAAIEGSAWAIVATVISCAMIIAGASFSLATIGGKAVEAIARQPEAGARIFLSMIIAAAMVEGFTFFSLLICFMTVFWLRQ